MTGERLEKHAGGPRQDGNAGTVLDLETGEVTEGLIFPGTVLEVEMEVRYPSPVRFGLVVGIVLFLEVRARKSGCGWEVKGRFRKSLSNIYEPRTGLGTSREPRSKRNGGLEVR